MCFSINKNYRSESGGVQQSSQRVDQVSGLCICKLEVHGFRAISISFNEETRLGSFVIGLVLDILSSKSFLS